MPPSRKFILLREYFNAQNEHILHRNIKKCFKNLAITKNKPIFASLFR